jgi:hypothetical protein
MVGLRGRHSRTAGASRLGRQGDRPAFLRPAASLPRYGRVVVEKPSVHADVRRRVDRARNRASAACAIDLVSPVTLLDKLSGQAPGAGTPHGRSSTAGLVTFSRYRSPASATHGKERLSTTSSGRCRRAIPTSPHRCSRIPTCSTSSVPQTHARSTKSRRRLSRTSSAFCWSSGPGLRSWGVKSRWRLATSSSTCSLSLQAAALHGRRAEGSEVRSGDGRPTTHVPIGGRRHAQAAR